MLKTQKGIDPDLPCSYTWRLAELYAAGELACTRL